MKKGLLAIVMCIFLVGCQEKTDPKLEERAQEIVRLAEADGFKEMNIVSSTKDEVKISQKDMCDINATFKEGKLVNITTKKNGSSDKEYSCVMRTLVRDQDFLGTDEQKNLAFLDMFRDQDKFEFEGLTIDKDLYEMSISKKE